MTRSSSTSVEIVPRAYDHPHAVQLVRALFDEQVARYGYADPVEADPSAYEPPEGQFLVAYLGGRPVACGGSRRHEPAHDTAEIKKMYTVVELRGRGLGTMIIDRLEAAAADNGVRRIILETGIRNRRALRLYRGVGYQPTARYVPGRDPQINRAFAKMLDSARATEPAMPPR
ncbi:MAG TPA: GNAT family N-acetyltransferase [Micromonosporaceae bacterium]|nr:GNAT family N-acetyltransferase [Micromonosporaceae bacterium]